MENRPRITLHLSRFYARLETMCTILLMLMWVLFLFTFFTSPSIVPVHFNASGKADNYGSKTTLLILPIIATVVYLGLTQLNKYPHIFNYIKTITDENAQQQYTTATRTLRLLKLSILLVFTVLIGLDYLTARGYTNGLGYWIIPFIFISILAPTFIAIHLSNKK